MERQVRYYTANQHGIYSESFGNESVVVNLNCGNYYSLQGIAGVICDALKSTIDENDIICELKSFYKHEELSIETDVSNFFQKLLQEGLIIEGSPTNLAKLDTTQLPNKYTAPKVEVFEDLQELFLLDPVHAVDNKMGWPFQQEKQ